MISTSTTRPYDFKLQLADTSKTITVGTDNWITVSGAIQNLGTETWLAGDTRGCARIGATISREKHDTRLLETRCSLGTAAIAPTQDSVFEVSFDVSRLPAGRYKLRIGLVIEFIAWKWPTSGDDGVREVELRSVDLQSIRDRLLGHGTDRSPPLLDIRKELLQVIPQLRICTARDFPAEPLPSLDHTAVPAADLKTARMSVLRPARRWPQIPLGSDDIDMMSSRSQNHLKKEFTRDSYQLLDISLMTLPDAWIIGSSACVWVDNQILIDSLSASPDYRNHVAEKQTLFVSSLDLRPVQLRGVSALAFHSGVGNYYHWHTDALASIFFLVQLIRIGAIERMPLLLPPLNKWQSAGLSYVNSIGLDVIHLDHRLYIAEHLCFPSFLNARGIATEPLIGHMFRSIASSVAADCTRTGFPSRIYVSRADAAARRLRNEGELIAALVRRGFFIIDASHYTYEEQVLMFSTAKVVVGTHGAGLTNAAFAPQGCLLIELFPQSWQSLFYFRLAQIAGHAYRAYTSNDTADSHEGWRVTAWSVDVEDACHYIDGACSSIDT